MRERKYLWAIIAALVMSANVRAADWPQWRGPFFNGSTDETDLPDSWGETENVVWIRPLPGPSGATPVICNGRIFVSSMVGKGPDFVALSFDASDGKKLWERPVGSDSRRYPRNNMASPSPGADGKNVFFLYGSGDLVAFDYEGNELWSRNIQTEYGNLALKFGYSSSPFLHGGKLFILVIRRDKPYQRPEADGPLDSYLMALDPRTGETLWKQPRPTNAFDEGMETYSTPIPFVRDGRTEILNTGADFITAHDPDTGTELWRFEYQTTKVRDSRVIPSLVAGDGLIFGARHKHGGVFAVEPGDPDNPSEASIVWEFDSPVPDCSTPLFYRGRLYVLDGIKNGKVVTCLDPKTGRQFWQGKIGGRGPWRASLTGADGKLYCINETGEIIVLAAGGDEFKILFETKTDEIPIQSSIAVADRHLFIRTARNLYCVGKEGRPHRAAPTASPGQGGGGEIWPGASWERATPEQVGMDATVLMKARDFALTGAGSGCVTRHGKLVMQWGDQKKRYDLKSTTKA
ncbi:MAG: outer membrane protein assembly factor BamB family protein, partial [Planctomycetota bacterium]